MDIQRIFIRWQVSSLKKISVVGLGPGNIGYITKAGIDCINRCEIAIGGKRQLEEIDSLLSEGCERYTLGKLIEVIDYIKNHRDKDICVIVSGDTGFYSLLPFLRKYFAREEMNVIPGISSFQYLFSRLAEPWHPYTPMSVHGREMDYLKALKDSQGVILLTDEKNTPYTIAKEIYNHGFKDIEIIVGERLSYEDEEITIVDVEDFEKLNRDFKMNITIARKK